MTKSRTERPTIRPCYFIGEVVKPYGKVVAILFTGGERYYMFLDKQKTVSLMPAVTVRQP
jgi:hypothetical protein